MFSEKGQTLMELIVVMAVSVIIIGALVFATISSLRNAQFAKNQAQATKLAQEGLERIRSARDRNGQITISETSVNSWNGDASGTGSIWSYPITSSSGTCESTTTNGKCYFKINSDDSLTNIGYGSVLFPESRAEGIPSSAPIFKRVIILSDDAATSALQKTVTVSVQWTDFSGPHESQLTTILRKI